MSQSHVPEEVYIDFLRHLNDTIHDRDPVILVLRGSLLLRHWYGESARPAGDIDFECFEKVRGTRGDRARQRFTSLVDNARGLCCFAAEASHSFPRMAVGIEFDEIDSPEDGQSLWNYGTPGERFYLGWVNHDRTGQAGRLQLDIAEAGSYDLSEISVADVTLLTANGNTFHFLAYTPEMLLAAKVSWLMRSLTRQIGGHGANRLRWKGELKDLFDSYLILTKAELRADLFQKSLLAVGTDDKVNWNDIQGIFDVRHATMADADFANWADFHKQHQSLIHCGPVEMLHTVADRLEPLLGDFYRGEEMPFLLAISSDPVDEVPYLVYADWLEERGHARGNFLRLFTKFCFHETEIPSREFNRIRTALQVSLGDTSVPWLQQFFGTSTRFREMRRRIENTTL